MLVLSCPLSLNIDIVRLRDLSSTVCRHPFCRTVFVDRNLAYFLGLNISGNRDISL
jgi:hypothetical protein